MKQCMCCNILKNYNEFYFKKGLPNGKCKSCRIKDANVWRKANMKKDKKYKQERSNRLKETINSIKSNTPCMDCGKLYEPYCMEYDHLKDKNHSISRMITDGRSLNSILDEIKKTELVCILCHRNRTYSRSNGNKYSNARKKKIELIWSFKDCQCSVCGIKYNPWQMDFDHIDPDQKIKNVAQMISHSKENILFEISKCNILCALCHRVKSSISYSTKT